MIIISNDEQELELYSSFASLGDFEHLRSLKVSRQNHGIYTERKYLVDIWCRNVAAVNV